MNQTTNDPLAGIYPPNYSRVVEWLEGDRFRYADSLYEHFSMIFDSQLDRIIEHLITCGWAEKSTSFGRPMIGLTPQYWTCKQNPIMVNTETQLIPNFWDHHRTRGTMTTIPKNCSTCGKRITNWYSRFDWPDDVFCSALCLNGFNPESKATAAMSDDELIDELFNNEIRQSNRIFNQPNHPHYGPVRRMWIILEQLDILDSLDNYYKRNSRYGYTWDSEFAGCLAAHTETEAVLSRSALLAWLSDLRSDT